MRTRTARKREEGKEGRGKTRGKEDWNKEGEGTFQGRIARKEKVGKGKG